ncbi:hypothetical protein HUU05_13525 [candidate division KSB1 bacterium]|nr:hypothetical protein [candidate division KSB1 bacterium]
MFRHGLVIESAFARAAFRVHENEFLRPAAQIVAIPELGIVREPVGADLGLAHPLHPPAESAPPASLLLLLLRTRVFLRGPIKTRIGGRNIVRKRGLREA